MIYTEEYKKLVSNAIETKDLTEFNNYNHAKMYDDYFLKMFNLYNYNINCYTRIFDPNVIAYKFYDIYGRDKYQIDLYKTYMKLITFNNKIPNFPSVERMDYIEIDEIQIQLKQFIVLIQILNYDNGMRY